MKRLGMVLGLVFAVILSCWALEAQVSSSKVQIRPAPAPAPLLPPIRIDVGAGGGFTLQCPQNCTSVTSPPNLHGETQTFCDCDGDGQQDLVCQVWFRTDADGSQTAICHPGCSEGKVCAKHMVERPDNQDYIYCACE